MKAIQKLRGQQRMLASSMLRSSASVMNQVPIALFSQNESKSKTQKFGDFSQV